MRPSFWTFPALAAVVLALFSVGACAAQQAPPAPVAPTAAAAASRQGSDYVLGPGDKVRLAVFGETNLTGDYQVAGSGMVSLPLVGDVRATGRTVPDFAEAVRTKLADGYLRDPKVSAEVMTYRPYYILGEIAKPGELPYTNDLTVMNAVATAGGFTYRADKKYIYIRHPNSSKEERVLLTATTPVQPGDTIRVRERYF